MEKIKVRRDYDGQVLRIVLAFPKGNVLDAQMMGEIAACIDHDAADKNLKAIVFEGEGKHFCFGASVPEHVKERAPEMIRGFHTLFKKLLACGVPTFALVRGQCLGGGMELAAFCNFVVAEPSAMFGQPEIVLGVFPPVAALILPRIVGQSRADDLVLTGRSIDAGTALAWGLVHAVGDDGEKLLAEALAKHILPKSAESLRHANRAVRESWHRELPAALDRMERAYVGDLMSTHDANEGIAAFLEKRAPKWESR